LFCSSPAENLGRCGTTEDIEEKCKKKPAHYTLSIHCRSDQQ